MIIPLKIYRLTSYSYLFHVNRTPAHQYTLRSPISLSRVPLKCPTSPTVYESEAAEALLSLFSPRLGTLGLPLDDDCTMAVDSEIQDLTLVNGLGVATASLSLMPQDDFLASSGRFE